MTSNKRDVIKGRVSHQQRELLLKFLEAHPGMASNQINMPNPVAVRQQLWRKLAETLNACPIGATRTSLKWAKTWQDWRLDVKQKASKIQAHASGTGKGSHIKCNPLTPLEEKVLSLLGQSAVDGEGEVPDPLICRTDLRVQTSSPPADIHPTTSPFSSIPSSSFSFDCSSVPPISSSPEPNTVELRISTDLPNRSNSPTSLSSPCTPPIIVMPHSPTLNNHPPEGQTIAGKSKGRRKSPYPEFDRDIETRLVVAVEKKAAAADRRATAAEKRASVAERRAVAAERRAEAAERKTDEMFKAMSTMADSMQSIAASLKIASQAVKNASDEFICRDHT